MKDKMHLAFYKGPGQTWQVNLMHKCVQFVTGQKYSHVELVIDGKCYSSSDRDGGVRGKVVDLNSGKWDLVEIEGDKDYALSWFNEHDGEDYDWIALLYFVIGIDLSSEDKWFCSKAASAALKLSDAGKYSPQDLHDLYDGK